MTKLTSILFIVGWIGFGFMTYHYLLLADLLLKPSECPGCICPEITCPDITCPEIVCPKTFVEEFAQCQQKYTKFKDLDYVMSKVGSLWWKYDIDNFNCLDFSFEFQKEWEKLGYRAVVISGKVEEESKQLHAEPCVLMNAQIGTFMTDPNFYPVYIRNEEYYQSKRSK